VDHEPLSLRQQTFVDQGRRVPQTAPVCISQAGFMGGKKFRVTPGTHWCGDGGWSYAEHFQALRSKTHMAQEQLVAVCISYNTKSYTYRFENSEDGCVGKHWRSGTTWKHAHTIHTAKDAKGEPVCVGVLHAGEQTRWIMKKASRCDSNGFSHSFSFAAMSTHYESPFEPSCLLSAEADAGHSVQRLATGSDCNKKAGGKESGQKRWRHFKDLLLLSRRHADTDVRICPATGEKLVEGGQANSTKPVWRTFWGEACDKQKLTTRETESYKIRWTVQQHPKLHVPGDATGSRYCLCRLGNENSSNIDFTYTWFQGECSGQTSRKELCLHDVSVADSLRFSKLIDEVT